MNAPARLSEARVRRLGEAHARRRQVRFWHGFIWMLVGSVVYSTALGLAMLLYPDPQDALAPVIGPSLYLTPLFGVPYLLASFRQRGWLRRVFYFTAVLTLAHVVANYLAWRFGVAHFELVSDGGAYVRNLATGGIGGFAGAVLAFAFLIAMRLAPATALARSVALLGVLALTVVGAFGMAQGLAWTQALELELEPSRSALWYLCVHFPWQAAFAFFLAWLMRMGRRT